MVYVWNNQPDGYPNKLVGEYDRSCSPGQYLLYDGKWLSEEEFGRCNLYVRSSPPELPDDPFIRMQLRPYNHSSYVFAADKMFYFDTCMLNEVAIGAEDVQRLRKILSITDTEIDGPPRALSDEQLQAIATIKNCPKFSRIPVLTFKGTKKKMSSYDCLPNHSASRLVNNKVKALLESVAPNDVQFFKAKVICTDGELEGYQLVNITNTIVGIDHEKSVYTKMKQIDSILSFKYLTYKSGCMGAHKIARDKEYLGNILAIEEVKLAFEKEGITGCFFARPEEFYRPFTVEDLIAAEAED